MPLQLDDLAALDAPVHDRLAASNGQPLLLPVADIDEDPDQPRREFDTNALQELADTIRERGVRQPISVRPNLMRANRWVLNFGARRLRASKLAGLDTIPAFVDTTADSYDQVIENEQREGLTPLELALFVQKRLALGDKQADIAKNLGRSRQWVTLATALIEAPDWLMQAYRDGRCRGLNELYDLRRLHGEHGADLEAWAASEQSITRDRITALRKRLAIAADVNAARVAPLNSASPVPERASEPEPPVGGEPPRQGADAQAPTRAPQSDKRVHVEFDGQDYQLVVSVAPDQAGHVYVRPLAGGPRRLAPALAVKLLGFVDG